jgi:hypothetical protein
LKKPALSLKSLQITLEPLPILFIIIIYPYLRNTTPLPSYLGLTPASEPDLMAVSRVRQPIESLLNWLEEQTKIQRASKIRSSSGLLVHVFGWLAAAMWLLANN